MNGIDLKYLSYQLACHAVYSAVVQTQTRVEDIPGEFLDRAIVNVRECFEGILELKARETR